MMGDFYPLAQSCVNCGKMLEARAVANSGAASIKGLLNLEYRHTDGTNECIIVKSPCAWDGWSATRSFEAARSKVFADHDAAIASKEGE